MSPERDEDFRRLAWTTAGLTAALGPHLLRLAPWVTAFVLGVVAWRLVAGRRGWRLPPTWARGLIALGLTVAVFASYATITGLDGGTALLALMSAIKLLETRNARDQTVLIFIGWFLCLAAFLYAQDVATAAWVLPTVWLLAAALLRVSLRGRDVPSPRPFRTAGAMLLKAAPVALVLFVFFPRLAGSFWGAPSSERAQTGLTEEMSPGDISDLTQNDVVAFRVRFADGEPPPPRERYWRALTLQDFDGYTWRRGNAMYPPQRAAHLGAPVEYTVTMEPTAQDMLFALDLPAHWTDSLAVQNRDFSLRARRPVNTVLQYEVRSHPEYRAGVDLSVLLERASLELPENRNPRTLELADRMRAAADSDAGYLQSILDLFREQEFHYTLTPPGLAKNSVDDFLFNTRQGFCGHYASAFTMMARAAGIPARVVAGYQGGDWNPIGGYLIVRQSHAHAWSEVWLPRRGWVRVDPTSAVAPERIERGFEAAFAESEALPGALRRESELFWQANMLWDNLNAEWNDWVVQFDRAAQESVLTGLGFDDPDWRAFAAALVGGLGIAVGILVLWLAWELRPRATDPAVAAYGRFQRRLARRGIERSPGEAPRDFAQRVRRLRPDLSLPALAITETYLRLRYGPAPAAGDLRMLRTLVGRFRP